MLSTISSSLMQSAQTLAQANPGLHWYALADAAQHPQLPQALGNEQRSRSLFGAAWETPLGRQSPWLVSLDAADEGAEAWQWLARNTPRQPSIASAFASRLAPDEQLAHLQRCLDLKLPDAEEMVLAFWDPAILSTLIGQADDHTLHVKGPILQAAQRAALLHGVVAWWYCDREGNLHAVDILPAGDAHEDTQAARATALPFSFTQQQVDALVEASVPDQVLYHLRTNQPLLLEPIPTARYYQRVRQLVRMGREHGLETFRDLCNFCVSVQASHVDRPAHTVQQTGIGFQRWGSSSPMSRFNCVGSRVRTSRM